MTNEVLEAVVEGDKGKLTTFKNYLITISVDIPYPKSFEYRQSASGVAPAVSRALKAIRKDLKGKRVKEFKIKAVQL